METQDFVVNKVKKQNDGTWNIRLGPSKYDPWLTTDMKEVKQAPHVGDIVTVQLPRIVKLKRPK